MRIFLTYGKGEGATKLAAFDAALWDAGIANYNIIRLSSVIPDNAEIITKKLQWNGREHGYRLYCVMAKAVTDVIGRKVCAGLGWVSVNRIGRGVFVEHSGSDEDEVRKQIEASLTSLIRYRQDEFGRLNFRIESAECSGPPVCALVAATYSTEGWPEQWQEEEEELPSYESSREELVA